MFDHPDRRRIYLMRHAEAAYVSPDGTPIADSRLAPLTPLGREQAAAQGAALAAVAFDRAVCSGLKRTLETATIVLEAQQRSDGSAVPELQVAPGFEEIHTQGSRNLTPAMAAFVRHVANPWRDGNIPGQRFLGGERFIEFDARVNVALAEVLEEPTWRTLLLVCHGGTNRAIVNQLAGVNWGTLDIEQDNACINIIDVDHDADGAPVRFLLRALNVTAYNLTKAGQLLTTMEETAQSIAQRYEG